MNWRPDYLSATSFKFNSSSSTAIPISILIMLRVRGDFYEVYMRRRVDASIELDEKWEFPGGKVEELKGENPEAAARREWHEETGMALPLDHPLRQLAITQHKYEDRSLLLFFFICPCFEGHLKNLNGFEFVNLDLFRTDDTTLPKANREVVKALIKSLDEMNSAQIGIDVLWNR